MQDEDADEEEERQQNTRKRERKKFRAKGTVLSRMKGLPLINSSGIISSAAHVRQFIVEETQLERKEERESRRWERPEPVPQISWGWSVSRGEERDRGGQYYYSQLLFDRYFYFVLADTRIMKYEKEKKRI